MMTGLDFFSLIYLIVVFFLAAIVRGFSGFGFSALLVLSTTWVLTPMMAVPIILMLELVASIQLLPSVWKHIHWPRLLRLLMTSAISIPIGVLALTVLDESMTRLLISGLILMVCILLLLGYSYKQYDGPILDFGTGFISGALNGFATIGGLIVAVVFLSLQLEAIVIRSTLVALFFATDLYASVLAWSLGLIDKKILSIALLMLPSLFVGVTIGSYFFRRSSGASFKRMTIIFLIVLSSIGFAQYFIEL